MRLWEIGVAARSGEKIRAKLMARNASCLLDLRGPFGRNTSAALSEPVPDEGLARADGLRETGLGLCLGDCAFKGCVVRAHVLPHKQKHLYLQA
jgi:hypothetical protein